MWLVTYTKNSAWVFISAEQMLNINNDDDQIAF